MCERLKAGSIADLFNGSLPHRDEELHLIKTSEQHRRGSAESENKKLSV